MWVHSLIERLPQKVSQLQCRLPQEVVKQFRTVANVLKMDLKVLRRVRRHRWLAQTRKRETVKGQI